MSIRELIAREKVERRVLKTLAALLVLSVAVNVLLARALARRVEPLSIPEEVVSGR